MVTIAFSILFEREGSSSRHPHNPAFAPWEQHIEGSGKPTVDIYALAASLYYAVTGKAPTASLNRHFRNEALPPAKNFGVKDWVSLAIEKGMASDPQKRPQSMKDWLSYLREPISSTVAGVSVQLKSARGVDYTHLRDLLAAGKWKEADGETGKVMLKAARREKKGYFDTESIQNFPCDDLRTIDQLWVKYSQGRFGFSIQKKIWLEVGGKVDYETKCKLGDRVGWQQGGTWLNNYDDLTFNQKAAPGHLPYGVVGSIGVCGYGVWGLVGEFGLFSRIESCKL